MDSRNRLALGLCLLYVFFPKSTIADLTTLILQDPILELRQVPTNDDPLVTPTDSSTTGILTPTSTPTDSPKAQNNDQVNDPSSHIFNYYFLLIAIFIAILLLGFVFAGRRRKNRTMRLMQSRHQALRRDVEGWPGRRAVPGARNNTRQNASGPSRWASGWRGRDDAAVTRHDEGLDDLGEAPPPYNPGDKPPSIAFGRRASQASEREVSHEPGNGLAVPLRTLSASNAGGPNPPGYNESMSNNGSEESDLIARPEPVVTPTTDRFGSDRRLLERAEGS